MASFEKKLKTFVLNTEFVSDRHPSKLNPYFDVEFIKIPENDDDIALLWNTIKECITIANSKSLSYVAFIIENCPLNYDFVPYFLEKNIPIVQLLRTNILCCNAFGNIETLIPLTENLVWIDKLGKIEFFLVFEKAYRLFFEVNISGYTSIAEIISDLTSNKLLLYPMILSDDLRKDILNTYERISRMLTVMKELQEY